MKTYTVQINKDKNKAVCSLDDCAREQFCYNLDSMLDLKATRPGDGNVTVRWLLQALQNNALNLSNELYQRLLVASRKWQHCVLHTVLDDRSRIRITQIHLRVINKNTLFFEMLDGQQRVSAILFFLTSPNNQLPKEYTVYVEGLGVVDLGGFTAKKLREEYPALYEKILDYEIPAMWYTNLSDREACKIFKMLNNTNTMSPQELRNAIYGPLPEKIREIARTNPHRVFAVTKTAKCSYLSAFGSTFRIANRMEADQYFSELVYMHENGWEKGVSPQRLTEWMEKVSAEGGIYSEQCACDKLIKTMNELLNDLAQILKSVPAECKERITPMVAQILVFYGRSLKHRYGRLDISTYVRGFFDVDTRWSNAKKKLWNDHTMPDGNPMGPFDKMFHGKNANAIGGIVHVLNLELKNNPAIFGVTKCDKTRRFSKKERLKKWLEQDKTCGYTGRPLALDALVADHNIPHSRGGRSLYDNLVVTDALNNQQKSNMTGDEYIKFLSEKNKAAA